MWRRAELKERAKVHLKIYYWQALLVTFMAYSIESGINSEAKINFNDLYEMGFHLYILTVLPELVLKGAIAFGVSFLIMSVFGNIIVVGKKRFFLRGRCNQLSISYMFEEFRNGCYINVMLAMFIKNVKILLWSLLLIVPGIKKYYEYYMVPYILSEYPGIDHEEALRRSSMIMEGEKWNTFLLELSFIGWYLLGVLTCGIGIYFVLPYHEATMAELYAKLCKKGC